MIIELFVLLASYLLGSVPFGLLVARITGKPDPRAHGSKNIGFTNVLRVCGKQAGFLTLAGDMGKGLLITALGASLGFTWNWILSFGLAVILGHMFSIFLAFKGGKGVATALGAVLGLHGLIGAVLILTWLGCVAAFRYSSGGALAAFGVFPALVLLLTWDFSFLIFSFLVSGMIFYRHRDNIIRLSQGVEPKIGSLIS